MRSPRIRYHVTLPDEAPSQRSAFAYLALLVVIVNVAACLIAERATQLDEFEQVARPAGVRDIPRSGVVERVWTDRDVPQLTLFQRFERLWR